MKEYITYDSETNIEETAEESTFREREICSFFFSKSFNWVNFSFSQYLIVDVLSTSSLETPYRSYASEVRSLYKV